MSASRSEWSEFGTVNGLAKNMRRLGPKETSCENWELIISGEPERLCARGYRSKAFGKLLCGKNQSVFRPKCVLLHLGQEVEVSTLPYKYTHYRCLPCDQHSNSPESRCVYEIAQAVLSGTALFDLNA